MEVFDAEPPADHQIADIDESMQHSLNISASGGPDSVDYLYESTGPITMDALRVQPSVQPKSDPGVEYDMDVQKRMMQAKQYDVDTRFRYKMDHAKRGYALIINNKSFERRTGMKERKGSDVDAASLSTRLSALGFETKLVHNQTTTDMLRTVLKMSREDHSRHDCFAMAILSHGEEGIVYGTDGIIKLDTLIDPFKGDNCRSLIGKPKIFIIQACRGNKLDSGVEVSDADTEEAPPPPPHRIPFEADVFMAFSTVPGYYSWRNSTKGSWFIQALCKVLDQHGTTEDLMWIMTKVNQMVAYDFESNATQEFMNKKKQIPCMMSMLTRQLYFTPKKS